MMIRTWVEIEGQEVSIFYKLRFLPGMPGEREKGSGIQLSPDDPDMYEILNIFYKESGEFIKIPSFLEDVLLNDVVMEKMKERMGLDAPLWR